MSVKYISVAEFAAKHGIAERTVRNYCARGELDSESRIQFEKDLKSDEILSKVYRETKAISEAIADRKKKTGYDGLLG